MEVVGHIVKFVITGLLAFVASATYTSCQLAPTRNVAIVPLSIQTLESCEVNEARRPRGHVDKSVVEYLRALDESPPPEAGRRVVQRRFLAPEVFGKLQKLGFFVCADNDWTGQLDPRFTFLLVHAAVLVDRPSPYLLKRSCTLRHAGEAIPLTVFAEAVQLRTLGGFPVTAQPEAFPVRDATSVVLQYDTRDAARVNKVAFRQLAGSKGKVALTVSCSVVLPSAGEQEIGGARTYEVKAPSSIPG